MAPKLAGTAEIPATLSRAHGALAERVAECTTCCPASVLNLGTAITLHAFIEEQWLFERNPLLDPKAIEHLREEHFQLEEDLELLHSLWTSDPRSSDLQPLAASLLSRLRDHVSRDERLFYAPRTPADHSTAHS